MCVNVHTCLSLYDNQQKPKGYYTNVGMSIKSTEWNLDVPAQSIFKRTQWLQTQLFLIVHSSSVEKAVGINLRPA